MIILDRLGGILVGERTVKKNCCQRKQHAGENFIVGLDVTDIAKWKVSKRILFKNLVDSCR